MKLRLKRQFVVHTQMVPDGAPIHDVLSFMFYQHFWDVIKADLIALFQAFYDGKLNIFRLNFVVLALILEKKILPVEKIKTH